MGKQVLYTNVSNDSTIIHSTSGFIRNITFKQCHRSKLTLYKNLTTSKTSIENKLIYSKKIIDIPSRYKTKEITLESSKSNILCYNIEIPNNDKHGKNTHNAIDKHSNTSKPKKSTKRDQKNRNKKKDSLVSNPHHHYFPYDYPDHFNKESIHAVESNISREPITWKTSKTRLLHSKLRPDTSKTSNILLPNLNYTLSTEKLPKLKYPNNVPPPVFKQVGSYKCKIPIRTSKERLEHRKKLSEQEKLEKIKEKHSTLSIDTQQSKFLKHKENTQYDILFGKKNFENLRREYYGDDKILESQHRKKAATKKLWKRFQKVPSRSESDIRIIMPESQQILEKLSSISLFIRDDDDDSEIGEPEIESEENSEEESEKESEEELEESEEESVEEPKHESKEETEPEEETNEVQPEGMEPKETPNEESLIEILPKKGSLKQFHNRESPIKAIDEKHSPTKSIDETHGPIKTLDVKHSPIKTIDKKHSPTKAIDETHGPIKAIDKKHSQIKARNTKEDSIKEKPLRSKAKFPSYVDSYTKLFMHKPPYVAMKAGIKPRTEKRLIIYKECDGKLCTYDKKGQDKVCEKLMINIGTSISPKAFSAEPRLSPRHPKFNQIQAKAIPARNSKVPPNYIVQDLRNPIDNRLEPTEQELQVISMNSCRNGSKCGMTNNLKKSAYDSREKFYERELQNYDYLANRVSQTYRNLKTTDHKLLLDLNFSNQITQTHHSQKKEKKMQTKKDFCSKSNALQVANQRDFNIHKTPLGIPHWVIMPKPNINMIYKNTKYIACPKSVKTTIPHGNPKRTSVNNNNNNNYTIFNYFVSVQEKPNENLQHSLNLKTVERNLIIKFV